MPLPVWPEAAYHQGMALLRAATFGSPVGELLAVVDEAGRLVALSFLAGLAPEAALAGVAGPGEASSWDEAACAPVREQLAAYFAGERRDFTLVTAPRGRAFSQAVWAALATIPYGQLTTYGELARRLGKPAATRAVGRANGANPIPIVIPCHRVIGADGTLTGYGGGLAAKRRLLALEGALLPGL